MNPKGSGEAPKGSLKLTTCTVSVLLDNERTLQIVDEISKYKLTIRVEQETEKKDWFEAIRKHIDYSRNYLY